MLHLDLLDPGRVGHEEARAGRAAGDGGEPGPADAAAPQRRRAAVEHHGRTVAGPVQEDGREVARLIEAQTIEHVAREDHQAGAARAEDDRAAAQVVDRARRRVGAHDEHARRRVHRGEDLQRRRRPADPAQRLVGDLALHEGEVEGARLEQRDVLGAALGVAGRDGERRIDLVQGRRHRVAVDREAAAGRGGAEDDAHFFAARAMAAILSAKFTWLSSSGA